MSCFFFFFLKSVNKCANEWYCDRGKIRVVIQHITFNPVLEQSTLLFSFALIDNLSFFLLFRYFIIIYLFLFHYRCNVAIDRRNLSPPTTTKINFSALCSKLFFAFFLFCLLNTFPFSLSFFYLFFYNNNNNNNMYVCI